VATENGPTRPAELQAGPSGTTAGTGQSSLLRVRHARSGDVRRMFSLINEQDKSDFLLGRSYAYLYDHIRDFLIAERDGAVVGCGGLHIYWADLAEIHAVAVAPEPEHDAIKRAIVEAALAEARRIGITRVYTLSRHPEFFTPLDFQTSSREELPQILWQVCVECPLFYDCVETVLLIEP
jgi:amino-acid N-acetyltransferase